MRKLLLSYLRYFPFDHFKGKISKKVKFKGLPEKLEYTNSQNIKFSLDLGEYQMKQIFLYDKYEKNSIRHMSNLLKKITSKKIVCFDVGANIGFFSLTMAKELENKNCEIHSFEPNPYTLTFLDKNLTLNPKLADSIFRNSIGLSDKAGTFQLSYNHRNTGSANIFDSASNSEEVAEIEVKTLDDYCVEHNINHIDLLKVDIEGAELNFLKGAEKIISKSKNMVLIMEIMEDNCKQAGYTSSQLYNKVIGFGFKPYLPKAWPKGLKEIHAMPEYYEDNIIFIK